MIWWLLIASPICGTLGRLGGAHGYNTKWRDLGCSFLITLTAALCLGFSLSLWWLYLAVFLLHWGALSTYFQFLHGGEDWMLASGFMVGCALLPVVYVVPGLWWMLLLRAVFLGLAWEAQNRYLPQRILIWRRDVVEEFVRYSLLV